MARATLKPEHERFVGEYLITLNAVQAYRTAYPGTTYGTAAVQAHRLLKKPNIRAEIQAARRAQQQRTEITADKVLREIARIGFADVVDLFDDCDQLRPLRQVPIETRRAIAAVKVTRARTTRRVTRNGKTRTTTTVHESVVEYKFANKLDALGRLFDHLGLSTAISPIESLLLSLPPPLAAQLRLAMMAGRNGVKP